MTRFSLTMSGVCLLIGLSMAAQQIRTGAGGQAQSSPTPVYRTRVTPRGPAAAVKPAPGNRAPGATAAPGAQTPPKKNPQVAGAAQTAPAQTAPMGPPAPPSPVPTPSRPADMPPVPPQVTYRNGMLTVNAVNSTLGGLLNAIRAKTGIEFDGAENASERVAVNLGPAPEGEVLAGIFSGSSFDYVVLGRADSPSIVQRVILTPKTRGGPVVAGQPSRPMQTPQTPQAAQLEGEEEPDEAASADQDPQDSAIQPPPVEQPAPAPNPQQPAQPPPNNGPKTPEQLLEELKQMQLQQQQQQGQPPPNPNSVPRKPPN